MYEVIITKIFVFDITSDADYDFVAISKLSPNFTTIKNGPILQSLAIMETESETKYCFVFFHSNMPINMPDMLILVSS